MITIKTHDGKWDSIKDVIDPLTSNDQKLNLSVSFLGLDTEFIVKGEKGKIIWPWDAKLPQERDVTSKLTGRGDGYFDFHGDGYATELCVPPAYCLDVMLRNLSWAFSWLGKEEARKIEAPAIYKVPEDVEKAAPEDAKRLGCMPSMNVYGDSGNPSSLSPNDRTTGCHLHISHPVLQNQDTAIALVKWADVLVGCTWTYISPNPSKAEAERRKAYGRAGEFRLKVYPTYPDDPKGKVTREYSHGVEYRVLPGTPIQDPTYLTLMFSLYRSALRLASKYGEPQEELSSQAKEAINSANKVEAKKIIRSLPLSTGGRKLIRFLRRVALRIDDAKEWSTAGFKEQGHKHTFEKRGIMGRLLSL